MTLNKDVDLRTKRVHLMGIGGAGMSGLAILLDQIGAEVSGCDIYRTSYIERILERKIPVEFVHESNHIEKYSPDILVYSSAIPHGHPEITCAWENGITVARRAEVLSAIFNSRRGVGVAGTHGKTTTSSMISLIAEISGIHPTVAIGGELSDIGTNAMLGNGEFMVAELDESDRSFVYFHPEIAVVTNIDWDHRDYYMTFKSVTDAFAEFLSNRKAGGRAIVCAEDPGVAQLLEEYDTGSGIATYGWGTGYDWGATEVEHVIGGGISYTLNRCGEKIGRINLCVSGEHNALNSVAACAAACEMGLTFEQAQKGLLAFHGAKRRLQKKGEAHGILIYDDYGHHPSEIRATLSTVRRIFPERRIVAIFQPHRFSRTAALYKEFAEALSLADKTFILPVYGSDEMPIDGVTSRLIYDAASEESRSHCELSENFELLVNTVCESARENDLILTIGAGSIGALGKVLYDKIRTRDTGAE